MDLKQSDVYQLVKDVEEVRQNFENRVVRIMADNPHYGEGDVRVAVFGGITNVLRSSSLSLLFLAKDLMVYDWWDQVFTPPPPKAHKEGFMSAYLDFVNFGTFQACFSQIEAFLRQVLYAIDPTACRGASAEFKSIYETLLKSKLSSKQEAWIPYLDLMRCLRNTTMHNTGVYIDRGGKDATIQYRGTTYKFVHMHAVNFMFPGITYSLIGDSAELLDAVVSDATVASLPPIEDVYMKTLYGKNP